MERPVYGRLAARVTLVTGGASGIGAAIARLFAREGAAVAILDVNRAAGRRLASELRDSGSAASFVEANVADSDGMAAAFDEVRRRYGRLDVVVNNAGIGSQTSGDEAGWWRLIRINVLGVAWGIREAVRAMRPGDAGAIVNVGSHAGLRGARAGVYGASKAAVHALSRYAALAHARDHIRVNTLLPGNIYTPIHDPRRHQALVRRMDGDPDAFAADPLDSGDEPGEARDAMLEEFRRIHPLGRLARVEDIAEGALYLASSASDMATGNELMVTGGIAPLRFRPGAAATTCPATDRPYPKGPTALVTANPAILESLQAVWERAGLPASVAPVSAGSRLAGIVVAVSPDQGGDLFSQGPEEWEAELTANLRAPWVLAHLASEVVEPGGAVMLVADAAGATGAEGSPAFCAASAALAYATDDLAEMLRARGIRLNTIIAERTSCTSGRQGPGGDIAELALAVARATSLNGVQLSLETTHA